MKKSLFLFAIICVQLCTLKVNAIVNDDIIINNNNIYMTKEQYDYINEFYFAGYADNISKEEFDVLLTGNYFNNSIEHYSIFNNSNLLKSSIETDAKLLNVNKSCSNNCIISTIVNWKKTPKVKSYDVIGARLVNTALIGNPSTSVFVNNSLVLTATADIKNNGFGTSFKLPSNTNSTLKIIQVYEVSTGGTLTASYQHAKKKSTLAKSKDYTIGYSGYGGVFVFAYPSLYDGMQGLTISL